MLKSKTSAISKHQRHLILSRSSLFQSTLDTWCYGSYEETEWKVISLKNQRSPISAITWRPCARIETTNQNPICPVRFSLQKRLAYSSRANSRAEKGILSEMSCFSMGEKRSNVLILQVDVPTQKFWTVVQIYQCMNLISCYSVGQVCPQNHSFNIVGNTGNRLLMYFCHFLRLFQEL